MQKAPNATVSPVDSLAVVEKRLVSIIVGQPAEKPDKKNIKVTIDVDVAKLTATFHCLDSESAGMHKNRHVTFVADADCVLHFNNSQVFGVDHVPLSKRVPVKLDVNDKVHNKQTDYYASITMTSMDGSAAALSMASRRDPWIIVP